MRVFSARRESLHDKRSHFGIMERKKKNFWAVFALGSFWRIAQVVSGDSITEPAWEAQPAMRVAMVVSSVSSCTCTRSVRRSGIAAGLGWVGTHSTFVLLFFQLNSRWCLCARERPYDHPVSQPPSSSSRVASETVLMLAAHQSRLSSSSSSSSSFFKVKHVSCVGGSVTKVFSHKWY